MVWLTSQSLPTLLLGCLALAALVAVVSRLALRAVIPASEREGSNAIAAPLMPALGAAFAILAALTLANEAGYLTSEGIVSNEAADASNLAWAATTPGIQGNAIQPALRRYLAATRSYEWHGASASAGNDPATRSALAKLERVVRTQAVRPGQRHASSHRARRVDRLADRRPESPLRSCLERAPGLLRDHPRVE